jgi:hypothetical protein
MPESYTQPATRQKPTLPKLQIPRTPQEAPQAKKTSTSSTSHNEQPESHPVTSPPAQPREPQGIKAANTREEQPHVAPQPDWLANPEMFKDLKERLGGKWMCECCRCSCVDKVEIPWPLCEGCLEGCWGVML